MIMRRLWPKVQEFRLGVLLVSQSQDHEMSLDLGVGGGGEGGGRHLFHPVALSRSS